MDVDPGVGLVHGLTDGAHNEGQLIEERLTRCRGLAAQLLGFGIGCTGNGAVRLLDVGLHVASE